MFYFLLAIAISLIVIWELKRTYWNRSAPGPFPWPIVGTIPYFVAQSENNYLKFLYGLYDKYGAAFLVSGGWLGPDAIFVNDPACVKYFLNTNFENYQRKFSNSRFVQLFGKGIFNSNGARWRTHRKTARPMFSKNSIASMLPPFVAKAKEFINILDTMATKNEEVDIQDMFFRFTLDSIGEIGFGYSIDSLHKDVPFASAFNRSQYIVELNSRNPLRTKFPDKEFDEDVNTMHEFIRNIIRQRKEDETYKTKTDLLSRFMNLIDEETGEPFTEEYLIDVIMNFFIAGRDTTACLLTWTTYLLSQNPQEEERLVKEINERFEGQPPSDTTQLKEFPLLQHVLDETLRLYPSVPFDVRNAIKDDVLPNGLKIKAGMDMVYSAYIMGRSPHLWKDALLFKPDRWLDTSDMIKDAFVPFHAGPQTCLGRAMAYLEAKTLVTMLLPRFKFTLVPNQNITPKLAIVMPAVEGMKMKVERRETEQQ